MRNFKKLISLALALMLCISAVSAMADYAEAPFLTKAGVYGAVADRLPVEPMVEDDEYLIVGVYGGELKRSAGALPCVLPGFRYRPRPQGRIYLHGDAG